jgi:hypothetical protein
MLQCGELGISSYRIAVVTSGSGEETLNFCCSSENSKRYKERSHHHLTQLLTAWCRSYRPFSARILPVSGRWSEPSDGLKTAAFSFVQASLNTWTSTPARTHAGPCCDRVLWIDSSFHCAPWSRTVCEGSRAWVLRFRICLHCSLT